MFDEKAIRETLEQMPFALRSRIYSTVRRKYDEITPADYNEEQIEKEIALLIMQELYMNLVAPVEMTKAILQSKPVANVGSFKIELSEQTFDEKFIDETRDFVADFWSMARELGFEDQIRSRSDQQKWKRE